MAKTNNQADLRRERILSELHTALDDHVRARRRQVLLQAGGAMSCGALLLLAIWSWHPAEGLEGRDSIAVVKPPHSLPENETDNPTSSTPSTYTVHFQPISDEKLLELLTQAGHPSALGIINGETVVIPTDHLINQNSRSRDF